MSTFKIAVIPGDGIGHEVVPEGLRVLEAAGKKFGLSFDFTHFDFSCERYAKTGHMMPDDLESIWDEIDARRTSFSPRVADAARDAIADYIRDVQSFVEGLDSESELKDHIKTIERFGRRFAIPDDELKRAITVVHERIAEIGEETETAPSPSRSSMPTPERESFDDRDLANLFAPLVNGLE